MNPSRCSECGEPIWDGPAARVGSLERSYDVCTQLCALVLRERLDVGDLQAEAVKRELQEVVNNERI